MFDVNTIIIILSIAVIADLGFCFILFQLDVRNPINQLFSLWMLSLASWTVAIIGFYSASGEPQALGWMRASYVAAIIAVTAFWYFSTQFPKPTRLVPVAHVMHALALALFSWMTLFTPLIVTEGYGTPGDWHVHLNMVGWVLYAVYLVYLFLSAHVILFRKFLRSSGAERMQLGYVTFSIFIGGEIFGVLFNLFLPSPFLLNWEYIWLGPLATTAVMVPFVAYAVTKHHLFNVRGAVTEVLIGLTITLSITDAFLFREPKELIMRLFFAAMFAFFGLSLVGSIRKEQNERERLQEMAKKLAAANAHLMQMDEAKTEFLSIASHELRTPVSVIKGYISLMLEDAYGKIPKAAKEKLDHMFQMNERLVHIINNLLNTSRIEKNRVEFIMDDIDIGKLTIDAVDELRFRANDKQMKIVLEPLPKSLPTVLVDQEKVHEIFVNLIDNAVKYSQGGTTVCVSVDLTSHPGFVTVRIKDQGNGMSEETKARIFQRYYRAQDAETRKEKGTGLGLYICKTFIEGMGGKIAVEASEPGKGTTFAFTLPISVVV